MFSETLVLILVHRASSPIFQTLGSLEVGKLADFVVLDKDYLTIPIDQIPEIRPLMTVVGGKPVFWDGSFAGRLGRQPVGFQFAAGYKPWGPYVPEYGGGGD